MIAANGNTMPPATGTASTNVVDPCYQKQETSDQILRRRQIADRNALRGAHRDQHGGRLPFVRPTLHIATPQCRARSNP